MLDRPNTQFPGRATGENRHRHGLAEQLKDKWRGWRNALLGSARFRSWALALPGTRALANRNAEDLFSIVSGFVHSQILFLLVDSDLLARLAQGPASLGELEAISAIPAERLETLLEAAQNLRLAEQTGDGRWITGDLGHVAALDEGIVEMVRHHAQFYGDLADPTALARSLKTGDTALARYWAYAGNRRGLPDEDATTPYSRLMTASQRMMAEEVLAAHDFGQHNAVLDIGGGHGTFLTCLARRHRGVRLRCFDLPSVAAQAEKRFAQAGLSERARCFGGNFFTDDFPPADCVTLIRILCDHDDADATRLLANIRRQMRDADRLVISEAMAGASRGARLAHNYFALYFLAMGSGRCRTPAQIGTMLTNAGFSSWSHADSRMPVLAGMVIATP